MKLKEKLRICLGGFLSMAMVIGFMPGNLLQVQAAETEHKHCVCGSNDLSVNGHKCDTEQEWTGVSDLSQITTGGYYYLIQDVVLEDMESYISSDFTKPTLYCGWKAPDGVVLCLNGHDITMKNPENVPDDKEVDAILVENHFTLTDCKPGNLQGRITHNNGDLGKAVKVQGATFDMYGGKLTGNTTKTFDGGGGVSVNGVDDTTKSAVFNLYGGSINGNTALHGGGVEVKRFVDYGLSEFYMYGGSITDNKTEGKYSYNDNGGGVYVSWTGKFVMNGGIIAGNSSMYSGGGVYASALAKEYEHSGGGTADIRISKNAIIAANTGDGKNDNLYLVTSTASTNYETRNTKVELDDSFTGFIGVSTNNPPADDNPLTVALDVSADCRGKVVSDDTQYLIQRSKSDLIMTTGGSSSSHVHDSNRWLGNESQHWSYCSTCGEIGKSSDHTWNKGTVTLQPTEETEGLKAYTCTICGAKKYQVIDKGTSENYELLEGDNGQYTIGKDEKLSFRSSAPLSEFVAVLVDGKIIDSSNYELAEGSTIVNLKQSYLDTLSPGKHIIGIQSTGGTVTASFTVVDKSAAGTKNNNTNTSTTPAKQNVKTAPKTSDNKSLTTSLVLLFAGSVLLIGVYGYRKRKSHER